MLTIGRGSIESIVCVILRVPALFIVESWFRTSQRDVAKSVLKNQPSETEGLYALGSYTALIFAAILATLPLRKLVNLYMHFIALILLFNEHKLSQLYVDMHAASNEISILDDAKGSAGMQRFVTFIGIQCVMAVLTAYLLDITNWVRYTFFVFTMPVFACAMGTGLEEQQVVINIAAIFTVIMIGLYFLNCIGSIINMCKEAVMQVYISFEVVGGIATLAAMWYSLLIPVQLLVFWLVMFSTQLFVYVNSTNLPVLDEGVMITFLASIGECCATPISLFALSVTISYASFCILTLTKIYLQGWSTYQADNDALRGWTEGFTMLLIAIQTGLLDLKPLQRAFLMSILLFIVASSLIQSMYEISEPILLGLSAAHNRNIFKHIRAVALFTFLWMFPLFMTYSICHYFDLDFWLLVIMSSCLLTTVQVIGALVVYALFMYDSVSAKNWDSLDDVIYYTRSVVRVLEFVVAVFIVCYGMKESIAGDWSWINSSILIIHCYFNVWQRLQTGWKSFLLRREAVKRMESLPHASAEQLAAYNDVCPICYTSLDSARITPCGHYFHGTCLKKWLYIQENCPMCHKNIYQNSMDSSPGSGDKDVVNRNNREGEENDEEVVHDYDEMSDNTVSNDDRDSTQGGEMEEDNSYEGIDDDIDDE
ncbi:RING finger protein 145-like [Mizuhopecten yessoensis]|uniref:RING finger protein 145 n=1 Tax=Mizuhopecten yessoensis TaxID=6573 RepID=A0A210Q9U6_MIZYE|nr:RING finger protein 145-like [Mizuhopecten yessoensis]XP_021363685.1 RING finger protein 145-like [Mizuhopecten yessoensis]OWF45513.1 RING finger protein 145 [Mizuhopecten yessoensis]